MPEWEDFYEILDVGSEATDEEIRRAWRRKAFDLHPDRKTGASEEERRRAEDSLKVVNRAYQTISDPFTRERYDQQWRQRKSPPRPVVEPAVMRFSNVDPRESQIGFFVLTNEGGPYTNIRIDDPDLPWLTVTGVASLGTDEELPLQVQVEATGEKWEQIYTATIAAWLDGVATAVRVELRTKPEPVATTATTRSPPSTTGTRSAASTVSGPSSTSAPTVGAASVGSRPTGTARPAPSAAPVRDTSGILVSWGVWLAPMALLGVVGVAVLGSDSLALWLWFTPLLVLTSLTLGALGWLGVYWLIEQGDYGWLYRHQDVVAVTSAAVTALVCLGAGLWWHTAITNAIAAWPWLLSINSVASLVVSGGAGWGTYQLADEVLYYKIRPWRGRHSHHLAWATGCAVFVLLLGSASWWRFDTYPSSTAPPAAPIVVSPTPAAPPAPTPQLEPVMLPVATSGEARIAFISTRDGNPELYVTDINGGNAHRLTTQPDTEKQPVWSPDGETIAFTSRPPGVNADGTGLRRLTRFGGPAGNPSWSPDGRRVAFSMLSGNTLDIYSVNKEGDNLRRVTHSPPTPNLAIMPTWSPDGSRIAYASLHGQEWDVHVINADGSGGRRLTTAAGMDWEPAWSPDGSRIAFVSKRDGNNEIYVMDADGSDQTNITNHSASDTAPSWSPDGSMVAFASDREGGTYTW